MHSNDFVTVCSIIAGQELAELAQAHKQKNKLTQATGGIATTENYVNSSKRVKQTLHCETADLFKYCWIYSKRSLHLVSIQGGEILH